MKTFLAWRNLVHNKVRTLVGLAGVAFAVILIFMQLGFLGALGTTATLIYDALDFDICIRSKDYLHLADPRSFPRNRLDQAQSVAGVTRANPFFVGIRQWRNPISGEKFGILVMGVRAADPVFSRPDIQRAAEQRLSTPHDILIDRLTRKEFGPRNGRQFGDADVAAGLETELSGKAVRLAGHFTLGTGFAANGAVLMNDRGFARVTPGRGVDQVNLGLIKISGGARSVQETVQRLDDALPDDVEILSRGEVLQRERERWVSRTSFGMIFQIGVGMALIVGTAIVYQVLSSDVANLLAEYATLKAIGYANRYVAGVVLQQALVLAVVGFVPGTLCSWLLYSVTTMQTKIPIHMTSTNLILVFWLAIAMCVVSGLGAVRKTFQADPAELF